MENIETRTKRKSTGTKRKKRRRTGTKIKRKPAAQGRRKLLGNLRVTVERSLLRKRRTEIKIKSASQMRRNRPCTFRVTMERSLFETAFWLWRRLITLDLCRSWIGGSEMNKMEQGVSWSKELLVQIRKNMKGWTDWWSRILELWLKGGKRTRIRGLIIARWIGEESGMMRDLVEMQWSRILLEWCKIVLKKCPGKEKPKEKEGDDKRGDKRKDKDREKKSQTKDKDREKEKKKVEKVKERSEHKNTEQDKFKHSNKNDLIGTHDIKNSQLPKECDKSVAKEGNHKKRKVLGTNGFLHDNDVRPNKMPRLTSDPLPENGRKLEPCQTLILFTSDRQGAANNHKLDSKERKLNGIIEVQPSLSISSTKPSPAITQADQIAEASMKLPHPDSKYLSQVFSVPKMDEWSDFDDQEWLFSCNDPPPKKPGVGSVGVNETPWVWAEALPIESADICALPYVIPY
uniref:Myb-like protein X n=2 Tax=Davidia involucrata TaxID=16924 RepID=A0A5B6Z0U2_DAVIN